jgi:hypothetical protein
MTDWTGPITIGVFAVQCCLSTLDDIGPGWTANLLRKITPSDITLLANRQHSGAPFPGAKGVDKPRLNVEFDP